MLAHPMPGHSLWREDAGSMAEMVAISHDSRLCYHRQQHSGVRVQTVMTSCGAGETARALSVAGVQKSTHHLLFCLMQPVFHDRMRLQHVLLYFCLLLSSSLPT